MLWRFGDRALELTGDPPAIAGILNLTPDSFSDGGALCGESGEPSVELAVERALRLAREGAQLLDLGAESTRPGFEPVPAELEKARLLPALCAIRRQIDLPISIDSTKPAVLKAALQAGAEIVNDVNGLASDEICRLIAESGAGVIAMQNGRLRPIDASNPVESMLEALGEIAQKAERFGIARDRLCLDPGIGFTPSLECDLAICAHCDRLHALGYPILIGPSRKRWISAHTQKGARQNDFGTAAAAVWMAQAGIEILRLHLVGEMRDSIAVARALYKNREASRCASGERS